MDPISNQVFSHDTIKYIYQTPDAIPIEHGHMPTKPFEINAPENPEKTKQDFGKGKDQKKGEKNKEGKRGL